MCEKMIKCNSETSQTQIIYVENTNKMHDQPYNKLRCWFTNKILEGKKVWTNFSLNEDTRKFHSLYKYSVSWIECKCHIFIEHAYFFTGITSIIKTTLVAMVSPMALVEQSAGRCPRFGESEVQGLHFAELVPVRS